MKAEIEKKTVITLNLDRYMINALFASWMDRWTRLPHHPNAQHPAGLGPDPRQAL